MTNKRINVDKIQDIQRLKGLGHSKSKVSKLLAIDRGAVIRYWGSEQSGLPITAPSWTTEVDWEYLKKELHKRVPRKILYEELTQFISMPSYQVFCQYLRNRQEQPLIVFIQ